MKNEKETLLDFPVLAVYFFENGKLYAARYGFIHKHSNKTDFVYDFNKVKKVLIKKYGIPEEDDKYWKNDLYKGDPNHWGMAVSIGHLVFEASWKTEKTNILLQLRGDNYDIFFILHYRDPNYHKSEVTKDSDMDKL